MPSSSENQWPWLLHLLAAGGFTRKRPRSSDEPIWPDTFPARDVTWEGEQFTVVTLPEAEQWLMVRPPFWQQVVEQARNLRERASASRADAPPADSAELRRHLVAHLLRSGSLTDPIVARAMLQVPRHLFLPHETLERAYADEAVITRKQGSVNISSASQPAMVAIMLEQLDVRPGMRVLEIGAGTGYNAALLAELVGPEGRVTTIDIDQDIVDEARSNLDAAGYGAVRTVCGDGADGFSPDAPYDRIILTVGAYDIAPPWRNQLAEGGVLLLPLTLGAGEQSIAFERRGALLQSKSAFPCGFIRLRGLMAPPEVQVAAHDGALLCVINEAQGIDAAAVGVALASPPRAAAAPLRFGSWQHWTAFSVYCAAHGDRLVQCFDRGGLLGVPERMLVGLYAPADNSIVVCDIYEEKLWSFGSEGAAALFRQRLHSFAATVPQHTRVSVQALPPRTVTELPAGAMLLHRPFNDLLVWL